jgi:N-methylhydantoinase B
MSTRRPLNLSVILIDGDKGAQTVCAHCEGVLAESADYRSALPAYEGPNTDAGPQIWERFGDYVDARIVFRQAYCPHCYVALITEVVPDDHPQLHDEIQSSGVLEGEAR